MNDEKLKKLFTVARGETPPAPSSGFEADVMRAIRHEPVQTGPQTVSVFDQLNLLFPKLACAAVLLIGICVAGEYIASTYSPSLTDGVAQLSDEWLFAAKGF